MTNKDVKNLKYLLQQANMKTIYFVLIILFGIVSSLVSVLPTQFVGALTNIIANDTQLQNSFINKIILNTSTLFSKPNLLITCLTLYILISVLAHIIRNTYCYLAMVFSNRLINRTRETMFSNLLNSDYSYFENNKRSSILYTIINNVSNLDYIFSHSLFTLGSNIFDLIWISFFISLIDVRILLILLSMAPLIFIMSIKVGKMQRTYSLQNIQQEKKMSNYIDQVVSGIEIIKVYKGEQKEQKVFSQANMSNFNFSNKANKNLSVYFVAEGALRAIGLSMALLYCVILISKGTVSIGAFPIVVLYGKRFYSPINNFTKYYQIIQKSLVSAKEVCSFIKNTGIDNPKESMQIPIAKNYDLNINEAFLKVKDQTLLSEFNLAVKTNEFMLVKGESGRGKTSLLKAILGLKQLQSGSITVNQNMSLNMQYFSYVGQTCFLHNTTLIDNVLYPQNITIIESGKVEEATKILTKLGFTTESIHKQVGEGGKRLSGGEKQRVSLARALIKQAPILILDEVTSNVDLKTENKIVELLEQVKGTKTVIFVTHSENEKLLNLADRVVEL